MADNSFTEEQKFSDSCCDIFNSVFSNNISHEAFWYKHYGNPSRLSAPLLVEKIENDIIGMNGFMAAKFICDSKELYAAQSCDSAVLPQYRGQSVFSSIIKRAQNQLKDEGVDFLFGFPNQNSYPGFIKLGWQHNVDFCRYFLPTDWYLLLRKKIGKKCARIIQGLFKQITLSRINRLASKPFTGVIEISDRCPFTEEDCMMINQCGAIMVKRSIDYYVWKLDKNPTKEFKYVVAREEGRLCGFIVYNVINDEVNIIDWFCVQNTNELVVMAKLIKFIIDVGAKINIPLINIKSRDVLLLKSLGFWNSSNIIMRRKMTPLVIYVINETYASKLYRPENWLLRFIDSDTIIS